MDLMGFRALLVAMVAALVLVGCDPRLGIASCVVGQGAQCLEYVGEGWTEDTARTSCGAATFSLETPCTALGLVGICTTSSGSTSELRTYFYAPAVDVLLAGALCRRAGGTFSLPAAPVPL